MPKFFIEEEQLNSEENKIFIIGEDVNHIKNVLRLGKRCYFRNWTKVSKTKKFFSRY